MNGLSIYFEKNIYLFTYIIAFLIFVLGTYIQSEFLIAFGMITGLFLLSYFNVPFTRKFIESLF